MFRLLKIEWLKVKNYKAFWIFLTLFVLGLFSINYIVYLISSTERVPISSMLFGYPTVWQTVGWLSSWLMYFPGMLMILLITNEFNYKTHRQNVIDGMERSQFITVKITMAFIIALIATLVCFLNILIFGSVVGSSFEFTGGRFLFYTFLQNLDYILFAMLLAFLLRRSGLAIIIFFLFGLLFEMIIWSVIDFKIIGHAATLYYFPLQCSDVLVGPPTFFNIKLYGTPPEEWKLATVTCAYIVLYCVLTIRKFKKEDL